MSSNYFKNFPEVVYKGSPAKNIMLRVTVKPAVIENNFVFMPLTMQEGERADMIANDLYNNSNYDWVLRLVNNQIDPYYDWYLTTEQFENFIRAKYGSVAEALATIVHYRHLTENIIINPYTYANIENAGDYEPITAYDYEEQLNEQKKNIDVLQPAVVQTLDQQLEKKLNE